MKLVFEPKVFACLTNTISIFPKKKEIQISLLTVKVNYGNQVVSCLVNFDRNQIHRFTIT